MTGTRVASPFPGVTGGGSPGSMADTRFPPSDPSGAALPALTAAERAYLERKAKEASLALIDHAHTLDGPVQWHYTGKLRGIQMYRGEGSFENAATAGTEFLCGVTTMLGSIEEVAWFFDQRTTAQMRARQADDVLDAGVLYSLVHGAPGRPLLRVAVKYQSLEGPSRFSRARDYCFLECQDTFRHASGRRGWVLSMHSIKLPSCPELPGIVRGSMYHSGFVFVEAEREGYMDVMHSLQINFRSTSRLPHFLLNAALKRRILSVVKVSREIQAARVGRHALLRKQQLMPKRSRSQCLHCARRFSLFVRKTRCRMCGEVVCQACAPVMEVDVPGRPLTKTRICAKCYGASPSADAADDDDAAADDEAAGLPPSYAQIRRDENETHYSLIRRDENGTHYSFSRANGSADGDGHAAATAKAADLDDDEPDADSDDGLEEQSSESVFAQSRFTRTSADSLVLPVAPDIDEDDIERYSEVSSAFWKESSVDSFAWHTPNATTTAAAATAAAYSPLDPKLSVASSALGASQLLSPEDTDEELDKRARRYNPTLSIRDLSREYGRAPKPAARASVASSSSRASLPPPPPPYSPSSEDVRGDDRPLDASALRAHNSRPQTRPDGPLMAERKVFESDSESGGENDRAAANRRRRTTTKTAATAKTLAKPRADKQPAARDDPSPRDTTSSAILSQVRANRSRTIQMSPESDYRSTDTMAHMAAEHEKRMLDIRRMREAAGAADGASKPDSPERRPASVASSSRSSRSSVSQRQGSDSPAKRVDNDARPSKRADGSERGSGPRPEAATADAAAARPVVEPTGNAKLISIRTSRATGGRATATFSEKAARASGPPPVESLGDLAFGLSPPPSAPEAAANHASRASETAPDGLAPSESAVATAPRVNVAILEEPAARRSTVVLLERVSSPRESTMFDEDLINRPTEDLMEQVHLRRNASGPRVPETEFRSTETMQSIEEAHRRRMEELNRIALDNMGSRISRLLDSDAADDDDEYDELAMSSRSRVKRSGTFVLSEDEVERSTEVMEDLAAEHQRRMDELNRIAVENIGTRISKLGVDEGDEPVEVDVDSVSPFQTPGDSGRVSAARSTNDFEQSQLEFVPTISEDATYSSDFASLKQTFGSSSTDMSERESSPRESNLSDMSQLDEDLVNRPTEELMDQVRANRSRKLVSLSSMTSGAPSASTMRDMERRHKERMAELNKLALANVGRRISTLEEDDEEPVGALDGDMAWRNTDMMEGFQSEHERKMEALREKLRQLEFECRESIASVLTPEEMEQEDEAFDNDPVVRNSDTSWIGNANPSKLLRTTRALPPRFEEPVSAKTLYEQIAELSKLQREMALAKDEGDEEEYRGRIKEQYRLLRSIKLRGW